MRQPLLEGGEAPTNERPVVDTSNLYNNARRARQSNKEILVSSARSSSVDSQTPSLASRIVLLLLLFAVVLVYSTDIVLRTVVAHNMFHYRWFLVQLMAFATAIISLILAVARPQPPQLIQGAFVGQWDLLAFRNVFYYGILDFAAAMCLFASYGVLPPTLTVIVPLIYTPFSESLNYLGSCTVLDRVPSAWCSLARLGLFLLCAGVATSLLPFFIDLHLDDKCPFTTSAIDFSNVLICASGVLLMALSNFSKKSLLSKKDVSPYVLNASTSLMQLLVGFVVAPLALDLQYFGSDPNGHFHNPAISFFKNFGFGFSCLFNGVKNLSGDHCNVHVTTEALLMVATGVSGQFLVMGIMSMASNALHGGLWEGVSGDKQGVGILKHFPVSAVGKAAQHAMTVAPVFAFMYFIIPSFPSMIIADNHNESVSCPWLAQLPLVGGITFSVCGAMLTFWEVEDPPADVDLWAALYEDDQDDEDLSDRKEPPFTNYR